MIRWKIVTKNRSSCILTSHCKYRKVYKKGEIVKGGRGTLGIFCFKTKTDAINFENCIVGNYLIIKVKPIGKGKNPKSILSILPYTNINNLMDKFYKNLDFVLRQKPPVGTICYPAVKVLE